MSLNRRKRLELGLFVIARMRVFPRLIESLKKVERYWHSQFFKRYQQLIPLFLIVVGKREKLLINLSSFINIGMEVNFRSLYGSVAKIFLYNPEIL